MCNLPDIFGMVALVHPHSRQLSTMNVIIIATATENDTIKFLPLYNTTTTELPSGFQERSFVKYIMV